MFQITSQSFKNGFVRILQGWKGDSTENSSQCSTPTITIPINPQPPPTPPPVSPLRRMADEDPTSGGRRHSREDNSDSSKDSSLQSDTSVDSEDSFASVIFIPKPEPKTDFSSPPDHKSPPRQNTSPPTILEPVPEVPPPETVKPDSPPPPPRTGTIKTETLRRIQQLLQQRTPLPAKHPTFPLVRRSSAHPVGQATRPIPRLLSLELFNPETDDLDSDSSGVSSPDSVISVMEPVGRVSTGCNSPAPELFINEDHLTAQMPKSSSLLEAAASVANSLEGAVDAVIQSSPRAKRKLAALGLVSPPPVPPQPPDDECKRHLTEFADKLSEKLLEEIDKYSDTLHTKKQQEQPLDPERYLQGLQEINSDIGNQLAKLNEDLETLQLQEPKKPPPAAEEPSKLQPATALKTAKQCSPSNSLTGPEPPTRQVSWEESVISSPELRREASKDSSGNDDSLRRKRKFLTRQQASSAWADIENHQPPKVTKTESYETSLSGSTSQDSLQSSSAGSCGPLGAGGSLTFHRYYHVFKEGELDALIDRYVENLHIISSYYDHANWCIVAEKVQVWTI